MWHLLEKPNLQRSQVRSPGLLVFTLAFHFAERGESAFSCKWDFFSLDEHLPLVHVAYPKGGMRSLFQRKKSSWKQKKTVQLVKLKKKMLFAAENPLQLQWRSLLSLLLLHEQAACLNPNPAHDSTVKEGQDAPLPPSSLLQHCPFPDQYLMWFTWHLSLPPNSWLHNEWSHIWVARERSSASCWWADIASVYP